MLVCRPKASRATAAVVVVVLIGGLVLAGLSADDAGLAAVMTAVCVGAELPDATSAVSSSDSAPAPVDRYRSPVSSRAPPLPA